MIVKTFEGINITEAMKSVKKEFGSDAVILDTIEKMVPGSKFKSVEVKAAIAEDKVHKNFVKRDEIKVPSSFLQQEKSLLDRLSSLESLGKKILTSLEQGSYVRPLEYGLSDLKCILLDALKEKFNSKFGALPKGLNTIFQVLSLNGISENFMNDLLGYVLERSAEKKDDVDAESFFKDISMEWIFKKVEIGADFSLPMHSNDFHVFVGPAGSGKTSVLVKIAAYVAKNTTNKVLFVSFDNKRIAASDQLRVYAKILGLPFVSINSHEELPQIFLKHRDVDLILIDTAGRNPKDHEDIQDLLQIRQLNLPINFHLVLSSTEKSSFLEDNVNRFAHCGLKSLVFTKLDESRSFGDIFNLSHKFSIPLSYFSFGQKIPGDFERASKERVVERLFSLAQTQK